MTQREVRNEIFKLLFEYELLKVDILQRKDEELEKIKISKAKEEFLTKYIQELIENEDKIVEEIKKQIKGWTFERLGTVEKVLLKMSFYEILIEEIGYEISINEAIELSKMYGDENTKNFINGILGDLIKKIENKEE